MHENVPITTEEVEDKKAIEDVQRIFSRFSDFPDKVRSAAAFLQYASTRIDTSARALVMTDDLAARFEPVCLWVRRIIPDLAPEVQEQALKIINGITPEETIAILRGLTRADRRRISFHESASIAVGLASFFGMYPAIDKAVLEAVSIEKLRAAKIGIGRLAGILFYAAEDLTTVEDELLEFRDNFDPGQINRGRLDELLSELILGLDGINNNVLRKRLVAKVEQVRREVKRPRPNWKTVLGTMLVVLSVVADVKSLYPEAVDNAMATIDAIIRTVVTESQVTPAAPLRGQSDGGPRHWAIVPKRLEYHPKKNEDEEKDEGDNSE